MSCKSLACSVLIIAAFIPAIASARAPATGYVGGRTKIYAGPDTGYPVVSVVHRGEGVEIHGCLADQSWCDVGFMHERGWMRGDSLLGDSIRGHVPVATLSDQDDAAHFNLDEYWDTHYNGRFDQNRGHWQSYYHDHDGDRRD